MGDEKKCNGDRVIGRHHCSCRLTAFIGTTIGDFKGILLLSVANQTLGFEHLVENSVPRVVTEIVIGKQQELFELAFELAYFIHANKEIAFFIAEDALDELSSLMGYQKKNRAPSERLRGFWKWGERTRPVRKTLMLDEYQMLQWLVFRKSEYWELQTEQSGILYTPSNEDLIVRYVKYLAYLSTRRGSFYVTLAICSILHQFHRRETRLLYDVLTQSDPARMKDTNYIGKQRLELLERVFRRFEGIVEKSDSEKQFLMQPASQLATHLVQESLRRFTPWGTDCVIGRRFDVTDIPDLYFEGLVAEEREDRIEMNRIHTVLHPECLERFTGGLDKYVRSLPDDDLDASCDFDSTNERLVLPQFTNLRTGPPRKDRFEAPTLRTEDYLRLRRTLDARGHRKRTFVPETLTVYADGETVCSFETNIGSTKCVIPRHTASIEIRGQDTAGEVVLAIVVRGEYGSSQEFEDSITHAGGQKILLKLRPLAEPRSEASGLQLEVVYKQRSLSVTSVREHILRSTLSLVNRPIGVFKPMGAARLAWLGIAGVIALGGLIFLQSQFRQPSDSDHKRNIASESNERKPMIQPPVADDDNGPRDTITANTNQTNPKKPFIASASWSLRGEAALDALELERTRGNDHTVDISALHRKITLSLPLYDSRGRSFVRFRITLSSGQKPLWQRRLTSPTTSVTGYGHLLEIEFRSPMDQQSSYDLKVEALAENSWEDIGSLRLKQR